MEARRIIVGEPVKEPQQRRPDLTGALRMLAGFCVVFTGASLIDMALAIGPADLSTPGARFVSLAAVAGGMPLLALGVLGLETAAFGLSRRLLIVSSTLATVALLACLAALAMMLPARGAALAEATEQTRQLVSLTAVRALSSLTCFGLAFAIGTWLGWRRVFQGERT